MSDLHNLSAPIEESREEVVKKQTAVKISQKQKMKEDLTRLFYEYRQKYLRKLFLSLGIAVTVCILLVWGIATIFGNKPSPVETAPDTVESEDETAKDTVKFIKFDGHQYYFYVPESYSFLNRTRNDDLNEVVFSDVGGRTVFILQEFETANDNEETLDSIYAYIYTTVQPSERAEIKIGDNTFKRRIYNICDTTSSEPTQTEKGCALKKNIYYSTYINGLLIIFQTSETSDFKNNMEEQILNTFTKNIITSDGLSEDYIYSKLPDIKTKLQAKFALGAPLNEQDTNGTTQITWKTAEDFALIMEFGSTGNLLAATGDYLKGNFSFNILDDATNKSAAISVHDVYDRIDDSIIIQATVLRTTPDAEFYVSDGVLDDNFWELTVLEPGPGPLIAEYRVTKDTGQISEKSSE